ncbi:hypothetical protein GF371_05185 [Candidatus Woesearchaeota archaeon]|nr:hypothetical protein [Candidatus Woesearchaeota archaeon]
MKWMHVSITVTDLDKTEKFYEELFGFERAKELEKDDKTVRWIKHRDLWIEMIQFKKKLPEQPNKENDVLGYRHIALMIDNLDEFYEKAKSIGAEISEPKLYPSGEKRCILRDPDGNLIEVYSR